MRFIGSRKVAHLARHLCHRSKLKPIALSSVFEHEPFSTIVHVQALNRLLSHATEKPMDCKD